MKRKIKIVGLGAGGHAKVVLDIVRQNIGDFELIGLLDPVVAKHGLVWNGAKILGSDALLPELVRDGVTGFFVGLGSAGDVHIRRKVFEAGVKAGLIPVNLIDVTASLSPSVSLGHGVCVMRGALVNAEARLGDNVCINTGAIVEHDCIVADHSYVAPGAILAGGVRIREQAFVGLRSAIKQGLQIGPRAVVGAGAMVLDHVQADTTVIGIPAKIFSRHD